MGYPKPNTGQIPFYRYQNADKYGEIKTNENIVKRIINILKSNNNNNDIYEFGTHNGASLKNIFHILINNNIEVNNIIGFDSLEGLPLEQNDAFNLSAWKKGQYSVPNGKNMNAAEYINYLKHERSLNTLFQCNNFKDFKFVKGFYKDSLKDEIISNKSLN